MPRRVIASGRSCLECRRRKIKCDRSLPCAYCVRVRVSCTYPPPRPVGSTGQVGDGGELTARVERLETTLQSLEQGFAQVRQLLPISPPETGDLEPSFDQYSSTSSPPYATQSSDGQWLSPPQESLHPSPAVISFIWQAYLDVVDPVLKIAHVPSVQRQVVAVIRGRTAADAPIDCLMFAIYYSTVVSISAVECRNEFQEDKTVLLKRYRTGLEQALARVDFPSSVDLVTLQAFVLYLICGRRDENGPNVRTLIGVATKAAIHINLHGDGCILNVSPFETEMRRRLWWHICTLDVRMAEDHGSDPKILESTFSTKLPLNINDTSLDPEMGELPQSQPGRTEMLFSLVRYEVSHFARRMVFSDQFCQNNWYPILNEAQKVRAIDEFKDRMENQYLVHTDKGIPLDFITAASTRLILMKLKLAVCKPRPDLNQGMPLRVNYQKVCEEVLQHANTLRHYENRNKWLWLFQTYIEWDALACLLLDLCITPAKEPSDAIWSTIDKIYHHWKNDPDIHRDRRWSHIEELRSHALAVRDRVRFTPSASPQTVKRSENSVSYETSAAATAVTTQSTNTNTIPMSPPSISTDTQSHENSPFIANIPTTHPNPTMTSTGHLAPMCALATTASTTPAATRPPSQPSAEEVITTAAQLPGAGTACEWSAALFGQYWDVVAPGHGGSTLWL